MLEAAKEEIFSVPTVWTGEGVLPLAADPASLEDHSTNERTSAATHFCTTTQLRKNSRLGFARKNVAPHQGSAWSNSASALGIREVLLESRGGSRYTGKERDSETNNDDFGARYYSSAFGRWTSPDWSAIPAPVPYANLTNPQTLNLYAMVRDNPETFVDLDGHCPQCVEEVEEEAPEALSAAEQYSPELRQFDAAVSESFAPIDNAITTASNCLSSEQDTALRRSTRWLFLLNFFDALRAVTVQIDESFGIVADHGVEVQSLGVGRRLLA